MITFTFSNLAYFPEATLAFSLLRSFLPRLLLCLLAVSSLTSRSIATEKTTLDGEWRFRIDAKAEGESQHWQNEIPPATELVRVPHTWNIGKYEDHEGLAWYFRTFNFPGLRPQQHIELHFGATFYLSRVWVNGIEAGQHEGGHTEYWFDVTKLVKAGQNLIAVELDNRPTETSIPGLALKLKPGKNIWYDWWHYGGIVRDVWLAENEGALLRRQRIRSEIADDSAQVHDSVFVENVGAKQSKFTVETQLFSPDGEKIASKTENASVSSGNRATIDFTFSVHSPRLWDLDQANLYVVQATLRDAAGRILDEKQDSFGNRKVEIHDRHLYLNGQQVRLVGMTRHEESPWEGLAETSGTIKHDYDDLKLLHTTLTRPVHYPQHEEVLEYADQHGIMLVPEIPVWQFTGAQLANPRVIALAKQMLQEMIEQAENHPSIFAWSVCNESDMSTEAGRSYFKEMKSLVNKLDPSRFVTFADNDISYGADPTKEAAHEADFIMMNQYYGAWNGPEEGLIPMLERAGNQFPDKMFIISEFGTPGIFAANTIEADKLRVHTLNYQLDVFRKYDWIAGAIFWCYQDYKSHRNLWPGFKQGYVDHGVVDEDRQRRPSFFEWQKRTEPVSLSAKWKYTGWYRTSGFEVTISRKPLTELPSYSLKNYKLNWEFRDGEGKLLHNGSFALADLDTEQKLTGDWPSEPNLHHAVLCLSLLNSRGETEAQKSLTYLFPLADGQEIDQMTTPNVRP